MHHLVGWPIRAATQLRPALLGMACLLVGCQQPAQPVVQAVLPEPVPVGGIGYIVFEAKIQPSSRDLLIADIDKLRAAGAHEIDLGISSPGGELDAAEDIVNYMKRQHDENGIVFKAYNVGVVASAATYVFLNAQGRYTKPSGVFVFHAAGVMSNGLITAQMLRDQVGKLDDYENLMRATLKARTRLTDSEALTYVRRTVLLNSDDAQRDGVVDAVSPLVVPKATRIWVIKARRPAGSAPRPAATPAS